MSNLDSLQQGSDKFSQRTAENALGSSINMANPEDLKGVFGRQSENPNVMSDGQMAFSNIYGQGHEHEWNNAGKQGNIYGSAENTAGGMASPTNGDSQTSQEAASDSSASAQSPLTALQNILNNQEAAAGMTPPSDSSSGQSTSDATQPATGNGTATDSSGNSFGQYLQNQLTQLQQQIAQIGAMFAQDFGGGASSTSGESTTSTGSDTSIPASGDSIPANPAAPAAGSEANSAPTQGDSNPANPVAPAAGSEANSAPAQGDSSPASQVTATAGNDTVTAPSQGDSSANSATTTTVSDNVTAPSQGDSSPATSASTSGDTSTAPAQSESTSTTSTGGDTQTTPAVTDSSGFQVANGQLTINGQTLAGVNVTSQYIQQEGATAAAAQIEQEMPGINSIRLMTSPDGGAYSEGSQIAGGQSVQDIENTVAAFNAQGIGVIIDNHDADANATDSVANSGNEAAWFGQLAQGELGNNDVMFQTLNEPTGSNQDITNEQVAAYNAIRATGSTNVVAFDEAGGGYAGPMTSDPSAYESMSNIAFDAHAYAGTDPNAVQDWQTEMAQTAGMTEAGGGAIPVYVGETGNSESGGNDADFPQLASAIVASGAGAEWFTYSGGEGPDSTIDNMTNADGSLNSYGQQVAGYIAQATA
jgi:Cellulase (glycosyl hydrolase family 5)